MQFSQKLSNTEIVSHYLLLTVLSFANSWGFSTLNLISITFTDFWMLGKAQKIDSLMKNHENMRIVLAEHAN